MELIIDANILFSALIKENITRKLLLNDELIFYAPEWIIEEFLGHIDELEEKTEINKEVLKNTVEELILLSNIKIIPKAELFNFINQAKEASPDPDDIMYFALALKLNIPIWSNDKKLKEQNKVRVYSTKELLELLKGI